MTYPKSVQLGQTRRERKQQRRLEEARQIRACYQQVDARDGHICRVCGARTSPQGGLEHRTIHHHLVFRSQISVARGRHSTANVITICPACHDAIHVHGTLRLTGDADLRDRLTGRLSGVCVERYTESGWEVTGWV